MKSNRLRRAPPPPLGPHVEAVAVSDIDHQSDTHVGMSRFYADWRAANRDKQARWVRQLWSERWAGLRMQGRVYIARMLRR